MKKERISFKELPKGIFQTMLQVEAVINNSGLDRKLLELLRLRVSQMNKCAYCVDMHHKEAQHREETEQRLYSVSVWRETDYYSDSEKSALEFAEAITEIQNGGMNDTLFEKISVHFSKDAIAMLTLAIAQINAWNRLMKTYNFTAGSYKINQLELISQAFNQPK
jgi:AhpD family alkylhydroperoxidase